VLGIAIVRGEGGGDGSPPAGSVSVPNVVGQTVGQARITIESADLVLGEPIYVLTDAVPEGTIVRQTPAAGTRVEAGTAVVPAVSTTRHLVAVPDVTGLSEAEAIVSLVNAGLRMGDIVGDPSTVVPAGSVIVTQPPAGREVTSGTRVDLVVSTGDPNATPTPSPTGTPSARPSPSAAGSPEQSPAESAAPAESGEASTAS
jgi:beta-lactam-binding protein with PASTA domain